MHSSEVFPKATGPITHNTQVEEVSQEEPITFEERAMKFPKLSRPREGPLGIALKTVSGPQKQLQSNSFTTSSHQVHSLPTVPCPLVIHKAIYTSISLFILLGVHKAKFVQV